MISEYIKSILKTMFKFAFNSMTKTKGESQNLFGFSDWLELNKKESKGSPWYRMKSLIVTPNIRFYC